MGDSATVTVRMKKDSEVYEKWDEYQEQFAHQSEAYRALVRAALVEGDLEGVETSASRTREWLLDMSSTLASFGVLAAIATGAGLLSLDTGLVFGFSLVVFAALALTPILDPRSRGVRR